MHQFLLPLALLATLPASAGDRFEVGLSVDRQTGTRQGQSYSGNFPGGPGGSSSYMQDPDTNTGLGVFGGLNVFKLGHAQFQVQANYRLKAQSNIRLRYDISTDTISIHEWADGGKYGVEYLALGGQFRWQAPFELGIGAELRSEKLSLEPPTAGFPTSRATYTRPWLTGQARYVFHTSQDWAPFIGLQMAIPLTKTNGVEGQAAGGENGTLSDSYLRSLAPKFQVSLRVGVQF